MKVFNPLTVAVGVAFVGGVSAATTTAPTKDITLDSNIVPTWGQLGTNANSWKIKLARVAAYWKETESRDISAARSLYSKSADKNSAEDKVEAFYNEAEGCLNKQTPTSRRTESEIETALGQIKDCIAQSVKTPVFNVASNEELPKGYPTAVSVDYKDAIKEDEDADLKEYSKEISLDTTLPTWEELGTNVDSYKIKLNRLKTYWAAAETRDLNALENFYATKKNNDDADRKVTDYYNTAETCLENQYETVRKTRSEIDQGLKEIEDCIAKKATPLTFTVVKTVNLPSNYYSPLVVDYSKAIKEDEEDDLYEAPKDITLDSNIVPTWDQLGTSANTYKIKLSRVSSYWAKTETRDISAARSFYSKSSDKNAAEGEVETFYKGAEACLGDLSVTRRKTKSEIESDLQQLKLCMAQTVTPPVFTVVRATTLPSDYTKPVSVDYKNDIKTDEDADLKEYSKEISLDTVLPTWEQLGTNANSVKIKLNRLKTFWAAAETRDKKAVANLYLTKSYNDAAVDTVEDFYNDAENCLENQYETVRKTRFEIEQGLNAINDCIAKKAPALVFTVVKTVHLPADYDSPLVVDYSKAIKEDEEADREEATPAPTPAPPTKEIALDYDIVPTWDQLGTSSKTKKIRLLRVYSYWSNTEARDKKAVKAFYSTTKEQNAAAAKIDDFYNGAKACLAKQKELERKTRDQVAVALQEIKDCIIQTVLPPVFTVWTTVSLPEDYFSPIVVDYGDANNADEEEDVAEAAVEDQTTPVITAAPLITPAVASELPAELAAPIIVEAPPQYSSPVDDAASSVEVSHVSQPISVSSTESATPEEIPVPIEDTVDEPPSPREIIDAVPVPEPSGNFYLPEEETDTGNFVPSEPSPVEEEPSTNEGTETDLSPPSSDIADDIPSDDTIYPAPLPDLPETENLQWPFSPASPDVPPLWALDLDKSQYVDASEWQQYIEHLHTIARDTIAKGKDPVGVALLKQIVDFHYGSFAQCITSKLKAEGISTLSESEYEPVAHWIETNCYVKFRYSLLAGAPPFEWIAKDKPIVTAKEIELWFTKRVNTARKDLTVLQNVSATQKEIVERFIGCAYASLNAAGESPIYRDAFYSALTHIEQCASA